MKQTEQNSRSETEIQLLYNPSNQLSHCCLEPPNSFSSIAKTVLFAGLGGWEFITPGMLLWLSYLQLFSLFLWYNANMTHDTMIHFVDSKGKWGVHLSMSVLAASHLDFQQQSPMRGPSPAEIPCLPFFNIPGLTLYE